jgi:hypothetical protein
MGRLDAASMLELARLARTYGSGELRLTEAQNVLIVNVPSDRLAALEAEPLLERFRLEPGALQAEAVSCTGSRYCSFALIPTKRTAQAVIDELERRLELSSFLVSPTRGPRPKAAMTARRQYIQGAGNGRSPSVRLSRGLALLPSPLPVRSVWRGR